MQFNHYTHNKNLPQSNSDHSAPNAHICFDCKGLVFIIPRGCLSTRWCLCVFTEVKRTKLGPQDSGEARWGCRRNNEVGGSEWACRAEQQQRTKTGVHETQGWISYHSAKESNAVECKGMQRNAKEC